MERLWCDVCGNGSDGEIGKTCAVCMAKGRGDGCGVLQTPEQAVKNHLDMAKAIKLARKANVVRGQKTMEERLDDMKVNLLADIRKEFTLTPKGSKEVVVEAVKAKTVQTKTKSKK